MTKLKFGIFSSEQAIMRSIRWAIDILLAVVLLCFLFSTSYFIDGSLEMLPTGEQKEKTKITVLFLGIVFALIEVLLIVARLKIIRKLNAEK